MVELAFSKWSPGGNTTLLFPVRDFAFGDVPRIDRRAGLCIDEREQAHLAALALDAQSLGGEQAGFADMAGRRLRMAGGEFCVNASRAFGALLALEEGAGRDADETPKPTEYRYEAYVSGWPTPLGLRARGVPPRWDVEARLQLPDCFMENPGTDEYLVRLPGIAHLLLRADTHIFPEDCMAVAAHMRTRRGMNDFPASGVIWWRKRQGKLEMMPLVHVRKTQTTCLENSCGSGALALALLLFHLEGDEDFSIMQPSGSPLEVHLNGGSGGLAATVDGPVLLVARGSVWLDRDKE